jgi:AcrR family transcriptional regulator
MDTREKIIAIARQKFAFEGERAVGLREVAAAVGIAPSVLYYYFADKDALLAEVFKSTGLALGKLRRQLPPAKTASDMLWQRIEFQLDHAEEVLAVLKYYLKYRTQFPLVANGYVPVKAYRHIEEVLEFGVARGEFHCGDIASDAKVVTHAINGFILEYYPSIPKGAAKRKLISSIHTFLLQALKK